MRNLAIRFLRACYRVWPFLHGRGWILRAAHTFLGTSPVRFDVGGGAFIEGPLSDYVIVWAFMREHERDAPFQRSLSMLKPGDIAIDVGANVGIWSLLAAKRGATVEAFEPVPALGKRLREHTNGIDGITIHDHAIGAERGKLPFFAVPDGNTGASALARRRDDSVEIAVDVIPLDDVIERADFLKVDVEGAEILVFRGAKRLLSRADAPVVFFEMNEEFSRQFGASTRDVKQFLVDCGYTIYRWTGRAFTPVTIDEIHKHEDLFAMKR